LFLKLHYCFAPKKDFIFIVKDSFRHPGASLKVWKAGMTLPTLTGRVFVMESQRDSLQGASDPY